ncbi:hypothetical protein [Streptomyces sp. NPDC001809]
MSPAPEPPAAPAAPAGRPARARPGCGPPLPATRRTDGSTSPRAAGPTNGNGRPGPPAGSTSPRAPGTANRNPRPRPVPPLRFVLLLLLVALLGTGAAGALTGGTELRPAAASPASDPGGGETHDPAATEAGLPGRSRRHRTGIRPVRRPGRPRHAARDPRRAPAPAPVPAPRGDALRCVVMRC